MNRKLFLFSRSAFSRAVNPPCPICVRGVLLRQSREDVGDETDSEESPEVLYTWVCSEMGSKKSPCDFALLDVRNPNKVRTTVAGIRKQRAQAAFSQIEQDERQTLAKKHARNSRIFFVVAALMFSYFIYLLADGAPIMIPINWACMSFMMWVFGMKSSYRSWQVAEGHLFEEGAFRFWLRQEKWLR